MNKVFLILFAILGPINSHAADENTPPNAMVSKVFGTVLFDGKNLKMGDLIEKNGVIETKEKSIVQIKIVKWHNTISMGPSSKMALDLAGEKKYTLESGTCRWKTDFKNALKEIDSKGIIYTKNVSMGVRGTDFLIKRLALFDESEIIMFDGAVEMANLEDSTNTVLVKKGQWGGLGGRYGKKIAPPIEIPPAALAVFEKTIEAP